MDGLGGLLGMEVSTRFAESWEEIGLAIRSLREKGVGAIVGWNLVQRRAAEMGLPVRTAELGQRGGSRCACRSPISPECQMARDRTRRAAQSDTFFGDQRSRGSGFPTVP